MSRNNNKSTTLAAPGPQFAGKPSIRALAACVQAKVPVILWGNPGEGKTATINSLGSAWNHEVTTILVSTRDATDFSGLPMESEGRQTHLNIGWALDANTALERGHDGSIIFLDEFSTAEPRVRKASLRILQERVVGEVELAEHVALVAAANPTDQAVDGWDLAPPEANRFIHIDWEFNAAEWLSGLADGFTSQPSYGLDALVCSDPDARRGRVVGLVTGFLTANPQHLAPGVPSDPVLASGAWPSPRSWHNLVELLAQLHPHDHEARFLATKGAVGEGLAVELAAYADANDLYDPNEVLADPSVVDWKAERPDRLFVALTSVSALVRASADATLWERGFAVMEACAHAGRPDVALPAVRELLANKPAEAHIPDSASASFGDLFRAMGVWAA